MNKFKTNLTEKYKINVDITIWEDEKLVWLNHLKVPTKLQRKKLGTKTMQEFCYWLDKNDYDCKLIITKESLYDFYKLFGFKKLNDCLFRKGNLQNGY